MIIGNAHTNKVANNPMEIVKKINLSSFSFHLKCLNFRANSGISASMSTDRIIDIPIKNQGFIKKSLAKKYCQEVESENPLMIIKGIAAKNIVTAGVGTPIKESLFLLSKLNLANLKRAKTGIINPK